jgi:Domain of unknown function (DUF4136)
MTNRVLLAAFLLIPLSLLSGQKVSVDYDKKADFSKFKTYAWVPGTSVITAKLDAYLKGGAAQILSSKGLTETEFAKADLLITYDIASDGDVAVGSALDPTYAASGGVLLPGQTIWLAPAVGTPASYVRKGSLGFRFLDKAANRVIWTATATAKLSNTNYNNGHRIDQALNKIFDRYPPKP